MDEYADEKSQKWKELKLKWSTPSPIKSTHQEKPKSSLNEKQIESESLSDIVNSLQKQLEQKQVTLKEIQSKNLLADLNEKKQHLDNTITSKKHHIKELKLNITLGMRTKYLLQILNHHSPWRLTQRLLME